MTVRKFTSFQEVKDEEYRYWQSVPAEVRIQAVYDHSVAMYSDQGRFQMDSNLRELLSALNEHRVRYLVVGGYAVGVHAQPRVTKDLDVFIDATPKNAKAVYTALTKFGCSLADVQVSDFLNPTSILRIGVPPVCVEIIQQIDGVSFETAYADSEEYLVDGDVPARYISAEHLILNKRTAGRLQYLADVEAVREGATAQERAIAGLICERTPPGISAHEEAWQSMGLFGMIGLRT